MNRQIRNSILLLITAFIWGMGFVSQSTGGDAVGPFAFNGLRNLLASVVLLPVIFFRDKKGLGKKPAGPAEKKMLLAAGVLTGAALFIASTLQQLGITMGTPIGKAGFITAGYILIVPIIGLFFRKRCGWNIWVGIIIMMAGLYLLCMDEAFSIQMSDFLMLGCAAMFAVQIMIIDYYAPKVDGVRMAAIEFLTVGILSLPFSVIFDIGITGAEIGKWFGILFTQEAMISVLYAGIFSSGVAYTLQIICQNGLHPALASMIMSFESVFAALGGFFILGEVLSARELWGCIIMLAATLLAQMPQKKPKPE